MCIFLLKRMSKIMSVCNLLLLFNKNRAKLKYIYI